MKTEIFATQKSDIGKKNIPVKLSKGGSVDSNTEKLASILNKYEPAKLQWDRGTLWIDAGNGLQKSSITEKFKGYGDSTDIGSIVWKGVRGENSKEHIERLTDGKYTIKEDFYKEPYAAKVDYFDKGGKTEAEYPDIIFSENFKNWFGDWDKDPKNSSKIVDENGYPLVCFHGTNREFTTFDKSAGIAHDRGYYGDGFYFTFQKEKKYWKSAYSEAKYYGERVIPAYINIRNPFNIEILSQFNGTNIRTIGTETIVFLRNIALKFPEIADKIYVTDTQTISVLPALFDKYEQDLDYHLSVDPHHPNDYMRANGYLKSKVKKSQTVNSLGEVTEWTDIEELGRYEGYQVPIKGGLSEKVFIEAPNTENPKGKIIDKRILDEATAYWIVAAIEKYDKISANYFPEGIMTRNPIITEAIKKNHDGIITGETGDELVVFKPTQIKLADTTNTTFDPDNPDFRFRKGGRVSPTDSATMYEVGTVHRSDNDGNLWIVKADKNGRKSWRRYKEPVDESQMPSEPAAEEHESTMSAIERGALSGKVIEDIFETESDLNFLYLDNIDGAKGFIKNQELAKEIRKETNELNDFKRVLFKDYFDPDLAIMNYFAKASSKKYPVFLQNQPTPEGIQEKLDNLQTLPSFKQWFGDFEDESARTSVVKRKGKPLIVYHGTTTQTPFSRFDMGKFPVMYFAEDYDYAKWFANFGDGIVYPVVLDIKYLFDLSFFGTQEILWAELRNTAKEEYGVDLPRKHPVFPALTKKKAWEWLRHDLPHQTLINAVKEAGYTGMKHVENNPNDLKEDGKERTTYAYMIFDPNQAKSILNYNSTRPDSNILFMAKGGIAKIKSSLSDKIKKLKK
jgi:hypothetical protein